MYWKGKEERSYWSYQGFPRRFPTFPALPITTAQALAVEENSNRYSRRTRKLVCVCFLIEIQTMLLSFFDLTEFAHK